MLWVQVRKELLRRWRRPAVTLSMLAFPFVMAGMIGSVNSGGGGPALPAIEVLLVDEDQGPVSGFLASMLGQVPEDQLELRTVVVERAEGERRMERGEASAMVLFPERLSESVLDGQPIALEVVRNPSEGIKPEIVEQFVQVMATALDLMSSTLRPELAELSAMVEADAIPPLEQVLRLSQLVYARIQQADGVVFPPIVAIESAKAASEEDDGPEFSLFGYILVMVMVVSVLFSAARTLSDLFEEEREGTLRRQLTTPLGMGQVLDARLLFGVFFSVVLVALVLGLGALFGWVGGALHPLGLLLHTVAFGLAACGLMAAIVGITRSEKQSALVVFIVTMGMSMLGGSFLPVEMMPDALAQSARFTLNYWAIEGYKHVVFTGEGMASSLRPTLLLLAVGLVTMVAGRLLLARRFTGVRA